MLAYTQTHRHTHTHTNSGDVQAIYEHFNQFSWLDGLIVTGTTALASITITGTFLL